MKRKILNVIIVILVIAALICLFAAERYQHAIGWIEDGIFTKAACYVDEFPFIIELYDPGFVSYVYAGEAMQDRRYDEAIELLKPLAERNYRDSVHMLSDCMENVTLQPN
jgi:hypothetical protein